MRLPWAAALVLGLCWALPAAAQVEYRPPGGGLRVLFPAAPRVRDEPVSTRFGNTHEATASLVRTDGAQFYAQYIDYPPAAAQEGAQRLLDSLKIGRTVKGILRGERRFLLDGHPAQRETVELQLPARPVIVALDVVRDLRLYSIFCIVDRGKEDDPEVRQFLDSFALLPL